MPIHACSMLQAAAEDAGEQVYAILEGAAAALPAGLPGPFPQFMGECCRGTRPQLQLQRLLRPATASHCQPRKQLPTPPFAHLCPPRLLLPACPSRRPHPADRFVPAFVAGFTQSVLDAVFGVGPPLDQDPLLGPAPVGRRFLLLHDDPPSMSDGEQRWRAGAAGGCSWAGLAGAGLRRALLQGLQAGAAPQTALVGDVVCCVGQECQGYRVTVSTAQHSTASPGACGS